MDLRFNTSDEDNEKIYEDYKISQDRAEWLRDQLSKELKIQQDSNETQLKSYKVLSAMSAHCKTPSELAMISYIFGMSVADSRHHEQKKTVTKAAILLHKLAKQMGMEVPEIPDFIREDLDLDDEDEKPKKKGSNYDW